MTDTRGIPMGYAEAAADMQEKEASPIELALNLAGELLDAITGPGYCVICDHAPKRGVRIVDSAAEHNHDCVAASVRNRLARMRTNTIAALPGAAAAGEMRAALADLIPRFEACARSAGNSEDVIALATAKHRAALAGDSHER
jgi:hypothetical protein